MTQMGTKQYAKIRGTSSVAVTRALCKGQKLVGVASYKKVGRDWLLQVNETEAKKSPKKYLVIQG